LWWYSYSVVVLFTGFLKSKSGVVVPWATWISNFTCPPKILVRDSEIGCPDAWDGFRNVLGNLIQP
jgi:hypothetical protein